MSERRRGSGRAGNLRKGARVSWDSAQGRVDGTVERKLTSRTHVKGHTVAASKEEPQYLVRSSRTGRVAAHKPSALRRSRTGGDS